MPRVMHKRFRSYSGPVIYGSKLGDPVGDMDRHVDRAVYLTEAVETGRRRGSVFAADGTGMTGGRGQHILVYPRELANEDWNAKDDQGGLGHLLRRIEVEAPSEALDRLWGAFIAEGWYLAQDGLFRWHDRGQAKVSNRWVEHEAGDLVHGYVLRDTITPNNGKVPASGERWETAKRWALLFHDVLDDDDSLEVQRQFEVDHLVNRVRNRPYKFNPNRRKATVEQAVYGIGEKPFDELVAGRDITFELDLAMCVFHSHTVNAPAIAYKKLKKAIEEVGWSPKDDFGDGEAEVVLAGEILIQLAKAKYGRWNEDIENGRWQRTRTRARQSGFWPSELFLSWPQGIMAIDMP